MYKYAIIENGKVVNVVLSNHDYATEQRWIACPDEAGIDWDYTNGQFVDTRPAETERVSATKEQLMAELAALTAKIQSLE